MSPVVGVPKYAEQRLSAHASSPMSLPPLYSSSSSYSTACPPSGSSGSNSSSADCFPQWLPWPQANSRPRSNDTSNLINNQSRMAGSFMGGVEDRRHGFYSIGTQARANDGFMNEIDGSSADVEGDSINEIESLANLKKHHPLRRFAEEQEAPYCPGAHGARLGDGHPTNRSVAGRTWSHTDSDSFQFAPQHPDSESGKSYSTFNTTNPSSWDGSPAKSTYRTVDTLATQDSAASVPLPTSSSYNEYALSGSVHSSCRHSNTESGGLFVKLAEVNNSSAGAPDGNCSGDDDSEKYLDSVIFNNWDTHRLHPPATHPSSYEEKHNHHANHQTRRQQHLQQQHHRPSLEDTRPVKNIGKLQHRRMVKSNSGRRPNYEGGSTSANRPFLCTLFFAGCQQDFATKNEWKRHVSTQHFQDRIWRCDIGACRGRKAAAFNRKDLFGQHLRRMHGPNGSERQNPRRRQKLEAPTPEMTEFINREIPKIQERCCQVKRELPRGSLCGFCEKYFSGIGSWEERMEHVGRHYESAAASGEDVDPRNWKIDQDLIDWTVKEGLVIRQADGTYILGCTGKEAVVSSST